MKKYLFILSAVLLTASLWAQSPERMSYQAVVRNDAGQLVTNTQVRIKVGILNGIAGELLWQEEQMATTNINGLLTIEIGSEVPLSADMFSNGGTLYLKTEIDPSGGTNYTIKGTSQLLSVPYALHAKTVSSYTETDPSVPAGTSTGQMLYWDGTTWVNVPSGIEGQLLTFRDGVPSWVTVLGILFFKFTDVYNPGTGKTWMDRNLGAFSVATKSNDGESYGDLYQWGRLTDGHQSRISGTTTNLSGTDNPGHSDFIIAPSIPCDWRNPQNTNLWQGVNGKNNPCPDPYRIPTEAEWNAERLSWSSNDATGAFTSPLKLPLAGARFYDCGLLHEVGYHGYYWSSTVNGTYSNYLLFYDSNAKTESMYRAWGFSVRCIKD